MPEGKIFCAPTALIIKDSYMLNMCVEVFAEPLRQIEMHRDGLNRTGVWREQMKEHRTCVDISQDAKEIFQTVSIRGYPLHLHKRSAGEGHCQLAEAPEGV